MKVKKLITELLDEDMSEEVLVRTNKGMKKIKAVISIESDTNPRYYVELMLDEN